MDLLLNMLWACRFPHVYLITQITSLLHIVTPNSELTPFQCHSAQASLNDIISISNRIRSMLSTTLPIAYDLVQAIPRLLLRISLDEPQHNPSSHQ